MASRKTIVLFIIFLALLAYVYFFEIQGEKRKQAQKEREELVLNFDEEKISGLSFLPAGIDLEKINNQWHILSPVETDADQSEIENILNAFSTLKRGRFVSDNPADFHSFGLTPYHSALVIDGQAERSDTLFIGDTNLDNTKVFYRTSSSNNVYLVPTTLKSNAEKSLYDLRDKSVLKFDRNRLSKISIKNQNQAYSCVKDKDHLWMLERPIQALCDRDKIDEILNELDNSKALRFASEKPNNLNKYELNKSWLTISLFDTALNLPNTLYVGKKEKQEYYARNKSRASIFLIDSSLVHDLNINLFDLRDKTIVSVENDSVTEIEIQYPDFSFYCLKDSTNRWYMVKPDSGLAKSWKVSSLLYDINDIEVAEFIDESYKPDTIYGFNRPGMKIKLKNGEDTVCDLVFGKKTQNNVYLKNNLTNVIYLVRAKIKEDLVIETEDYIEKN